MSLAKITVTRPANATAYTALDVVGGLLTFPLVANPGQLSEVIHAALHYRVAAVPAGMGAFKLHLYNASPTVIADNAAFDIPVGDADKYMGFVDLVVPVDYGATIYTQVAVGQGRMIMPLETSVYGYLQTVGGYTPAGNSEVLTLALALRGV